MEHDGVLWLRCLLSARLAVLRSSSSGVFNATTAVADAAATAACCSHIQIEKPNRMTRRPRAHHCHQHQRITQTPKHASADTNQCVAIIDPIDGVPD